MRHSCLIRSFALGRLRPTVCLRGHTDLRNRRNETNGNSDAGRFFVQTKGSAVQMGTRAVNREDNKD
ncbi:hypothetical protein Tco_0492810 [Tanacetum coccineum]